MLVNRVHPDQACLQSTVASFHDLSHAIWHGGVCLRVEPSCRLCVAVQCICAQSLLALTDSERLAADSTLMLNLQHRHVGFVVQGFRYQTLK